MKKFWACEMDVTSNDGSYYHCHHHLVYGTEADAREYFGYEAEQWQNEAHGEVDVYPEYVYQVEPTSSEIVELDRHKMVDEDGNQVYDTTKAAQCVCWKELRRKFVYEFADGAKASFIDLDAEVDPVM